MNEGEHLDHHELMTLTGPAEAFAAVDLGLSAAC
jgi:hypothetical protein